jgi:hypothetical protein
MELRVQLKVCEGCGCLWYRPQNHCSTYCRECAVRLKDFPVDNRRRRRSDVNSELDCDPQLTGAWAAAGGPQ